MVPPKFRNVICPWQTEREIKSQVRTAEKVIYGLSEKEQEKLLRLDKPDRVWRYSGV